MTSPQRRELPTIGVLAGWQYYWTATPLSYLDPIYRGVRLAAQELNCNLLLGCGMGPSALSSESPRPAWPDVSNQSDFVPIGPWNTNGLIIVNPLLAEARSQYIQGVIASGHPVMFIGSGEKGPTILADNTAGITEALQHLVEHGHRHIAFIAGSPDDMGGDTGERLKAYQEGCEAYDLARNKHLVAFGWHTYAAGARAMQQIMATGASFTAVLTSNDESALGAIQALKEAGRIVPDDVAIIGFDDRPESVVQKPALTSVQIPLFKMGYRALELLLANVQGQTANIRLEKIPTRLITRESCGCGHSAVIADAHEVVTPTIEEKELASIQAKLAHMMSTYVFAESQGTGKDEVDFLSQRLVKSYVNSLQNQDPVQFQSTLDQVLNRVAAGQDDMHVWQIAISVLRRELPHLLALWPQPAPHDLAYVVLDQARVTISSAMRQQHRRYAVDQRWRSDRISILTARLLTTLDEAQIYDILAQYLPEMGFRTTWLALFEAEEDDLVGWSRMSDATNAKKPSIRIRSRAFPPSNWTIEEDPFCLTLLPLVGLLGRSGFVAFDAILLDIQGAIAQQMAAALNTAQLYREATEGRRLAEDANQMKSRFLSTVSHELRTPLNLIAGTSGLLLQESEESDEPLPAALQKDVERIYGNTQHLDRLISDVLDLASSDAGQLRLTFDFVDLGQTMRMAAETGRGMAADKGLAWRESLPESEPWVWGDRTRLRQVALNLISNAVKYTSKGEVSFCLETDSDMVTVSVRDTGLGLPLEEQQIIFDEFQRSERSITHGYSGLGLGLAICKRLVTAHQGTIGVRSNGEIGAGSTFFFSLSVVPAPSGQALHPSIKPKTKPRILVLSSQAGGQRLRDHLVKNGFQAEVTPIEDSVTWLSQLLEGPHSAVVLDITQAAEHGWQALNILKSNPATQTVPTLFYAATYDSGVVLEFDYLTKPIEVADLTRALDQQWLVTDATAQVHTFLVVDDDSNTLDLHARIIRSQAQANRVLTARNGLEALEVLQQTKVDLVLLDLMMPELDGFGVLEAMRSDESTRNIPVIVVTGQMLTEAEMARLNHGVATVLSKGMFDLEETLAHLDAALERQHKLSDEAQRLVRKTMAFLHNHYAEPLSRSDLARHVGMSDDYLSYCFRQELGLTPIAYLNRYRIAQAKHMLTETDKSITVIALDVGFSNSAYFSRVFRREVGVSPGTFRRQQG